MTQTRSFNDHYINQLTHKVSLEFTSSEDFTVTSYTESNFNILRANVAGMRKEISIHAEENFVTIKLVGTLEEVRVSSITLSHRFLTAIIVELFTVGNWIDLVNAEEN